MEKNDRENMDVEKRENRAVTESLTRIKGEACSAVISPLSIISFSFMPAAIPAR